MDYCYDYVADVIDEIALEGLDGITLQGLWVRLFHRPKFIYKPIDDFTKRFLWKAIVRISCIDFYELPTERNDLVTFIRSNYIDSFGNFYEPADMPECLYPHAPVDDGKVLGSCPTYSTRKNITDIARQEDFDTAQRRGNFLVMVANQKTRSAALYCMDFNIVTELGVVPYCILERIGRSRYEGEVTQGKRGLQVVTVDSKMLYYFRKLLVKHKLVRKQVFYMKVVKQTSTGTLFHLPRFYSEMRSRQDTDALKVIEHLEKAPLKCIPLKSIKSQLNIELKKLIIKYPKNFKTAQVPYRVIYPGSKPYDWKIKSSGEERSVRVLKLLNSSLAKDDEEDEDDEEEVGLMDESQRRIDRSLMRQAYYIVEQAGPRGIKQAALGSLLAVPSLQARSICKHLVKRKLVKTSFIDIGRQRITHFYCNKFDSAASSLTNEIREEKNKLLQAISMSTTIVDESLVNESTSHDLNTSQSLTETDNETITENTTTNETAINTETTLSNKTAEKGGLKEDITAEIIINKPELSGENSRGLAEGLEKVDTTRASNAITARMLKRASIIVQSVNLHKVIQDTQKVQRIISEEEENEGLKQTVDRKTIQRLLDKLETDGLLKTIKVNLRGYGKEKSMLFICHPSVNETHSEIQSAIEQAKMKLPIVSAHHTKKNLNKKVKTKHQTLKYDPKAGRKYGYKPKCVRMRILHTYMYYLIYGYDGDPNLDQSCKQEIVDKLGVDKSVLDEMSFVYRTEVDWKMFLPPLPTHAEYTTGWCLLSDVLLRLPLCLFVSIVNVNYNIPGLADYLNHPLKRFFLVKELPTAILHHLTLMRKYIFVVSDIVARLGFIGLIQMGPQKLKEKDQVFIHLNKHAILYNTTTSDVGYNHISKDKEYECMRYEFTTLEDVEQYWYDLWNYSMNTNLGNRNSMTGQPVVVESVNTKKELLAAIQTKTAEEVKACDVGYLPGDNLGAAGLDSDMFVHLKRNWYWSGKKIEGAVDESTILFPPVMKNSKADSLKKVAGKIRPIDSSKLKAKEAKETAQPKHPKVHSAEPTRTLKQPLPTAWKSRAVSKKKTRILKQRKSKFPRKPYYDQKDKEALSKMVKLRVDWSPTEDNLLLICKVASLYMSPYKRRQVAKNFCAVREILHSTYPAISKNKTSRACQRRMHYMMKNPFTAQSVYMCLEEIKQDTEIHTKFHRAVEKLDALLKAQGEGPKGYQEEYDKIFMNLVATLLKKLKTITNPDKPFYEITLPDTVEEFVKTYNPFTPKPVSVKRGMFNEVQKEIEIKAAVINSVIHSSLCCTTEKTSYSNQLFYIYQQYPDKLLRHVMAKCRTMQIISCRKRYKRWKTLGNDCLPLASSPYQLSITYVHILQTKYQYNIFSECYNGFKLMMDEIPQSNAAKKVKHSPKEITEKGPQKITVSVEVNSGGQCANIVELFSNELISMNVEFPDQLIVLDPRLSETEESYKLIMKRFREMLTIIKDARKKDSKTPLSDDEDDEDDIGADNNELEDTYFEQFNLKNKTGVANTASRLALYLMRDEPLEQLDNSLQHAHDYFVLNPCKVTANVDMSKAEESIFFKDLKVKVIADIKRFASFPAEERKTNDEIVDTFDENCKTLVKSFLEFLESKAELGATYDEVMDNFKEDEEDLKQIIYLLVDKQYILKTGLVLPRFVHNNYSKVWLVKSFHILRLVRDSLGAEKSNSAYAISFAENEAALRRKLKLNQGKRSLDSADAPQAKKPKLDTSSGDNDINVGASTSSHDAPDTPSTINNSDINSPPRKRLRTRSSSNEQKPVETSIGETEKKAEAETEGDKVKSSTAQAENEEGEQQTRFLVKSTNKKWIHLPNENLKKFESFDPSEAKHIYVNVRPWIKVDGTLNRRVLDRLLGSVLGHCLAAPGTSATKVQERFSPAIQPAHTYELLEILQKINCIRLVELKKSWKASLFSKRVNITPSPAEGVGSVTNIIVEPDPLAVSRLGYFIGDKCYSIDYLAQLTYSNREGLLS